MSETTSPPVYDDMLFGPSTDQRQSLLSSYLTQVAHLHGLSDHLGRDAPSIADLAPPPTQYAGQIWPAGNAVGTEHQTLPPAPTFEWSVTPGGRLAASANDNPLTQGTPSPGQAIAHTGQDVGDWVQRQRDEAERLGLWDPETNRPTAKGILEAAQEYGGAMLGGTEAPKAGAAAMKAPGETFTSWINRLAGDERGGGPNPLAKRARKAPKAPDNPLEQISKDNPLAAMERPEPAGEEFTVPSRIISPAAAKKLGLNAYGAKENRVGLDTYMQPGVSDLRERHAGLIKGYGGIVGVHPDMTADEAGKAFLNHLHGNVSGLYNELVDQWGMPIVRDASRWYDGANKIVHREAENFGLEPQQVAGTFAALSPQKDWNQNVLQGRRLMMADNAGNQMGPNGTFTPKMKEWVNNYILTIKNESDLTGDALRAKIAEERKAFKEIMNVPYRDLKTYLEKARWARAWEQANFPDRSYRLVGPNGEELGFAQTKGGENRAHSWGSFKEIANALKAMHGDQNQISQAVGSQHKVRSFYNNLIAPWSPAGHTTIDTHAIAGALFRPLGSKSTEVAHGLGTSPSPIKNPETGEKFRPIGASGHAETGISGMYPLFHEAYGRAANGSELWIPRQMQSITWEGTRSLFPDVLKRNKAFQAEAHKVWQDAAAGKLSPEEARAKIIVRAAEVMKGEPGKIPLPEWAR